MVADSAKSPTFRRCIFTLKKAPWVFLALQLPELATDPLGKFLNADGHRNWLLLFLTLAPYYFVSSLITNSMSFSAVLNLEEGRPATVHSAWNSIRPKLISFVPIALLLGAMVLLGILAFILPGIYFSTIYVFVPCLVVTEPKSPWSLYLHKSKQIARKHLTRTALVVATLILVNLSIEVLFATPNHTWNLLRNPVASGWYLAKLLISSIVGAFASIWISFLFLDSRQEVASA